jgi:hypothetical protein
VPRAHTDRAYEGELAKLRERLLLMGTRVEEIIQGSMQSLLERDTELAQRMIQADRRASISSSCRSTGFACSCSPAASRSPPTCASSRSP